jgi:two-component system, NtrC family, sensor kinase
MFKHIQQGLGLRLFIVTYAIMVLSFSLYTFHILKRHRADLMTSVHAHSYQIGDLIKRSTRLGMLLDKKEEVQSIVTNLAKEPGVVAVKIYNKNGQAIFASEPQERRSVITINEIICQTCHFSDPPNVNLKIDDRTRIIELGDRRLLSVVTEIPNEPSCSEAACHIHSSKQNVLGVMDVHMSLNTIDEQIRNSQKSMVSYAIYITLGVAFIFGLFIYFGVKERVSKLIKGTEELAKGNLDFRIEVNGRDEMSKLAASFNDMTQDLNKAKQEVTQWSSSLEEKVKEKQEELSRTQDHLIRIEKLASLGKLSAVVAHEINNPLAGSLNYTMLAMRLLKNEDYSEKQKQSVLEYLDFVSKEISRVGKIIKNMLVFAKETSGEIREDYVHNMIDSARMLVNHHMEINEISVETNMECIDDLVVWDAGQIRQALVSLFINSIEAMDKNGKLSIKSVCGSDNDLIKLEIKDTGRGISEEHLPHIFDPFFSTKKEGKGVGLGLAVVYGIIENHKGKIWAESSKEGTIFFIEIPRKPEFESKVKVDPDLNNS